MKNKQMREYEKKMESCDYECYSHIHYLHGKAYDLRDFYEQHPGGVDILVKSAGMPDSTALFESYHAFASRSYIMKQLEKYEIKDEDIISMKPNRLFSFDLNGFYMTLVNRVRHEFECNSNDKILIDQIKANRFYWIKVAFLSLLFCYCYTHAFLLHVPNAAYYAALSGILHFSLMFCVSHDASHFAIVSKNRSVNKSISNYLFSTILWDANIWFLHHTILHHSFTGSAKLDPDVRHAHPIIRKSVFVPKKKVYPTVESIGDMFGYFGVACSVIIIYIAFPGMWIGQVRSYIMYSLGYSKRLWGMPTHDMKLNISYLFISSFMILIHIFRCSVIVTLVYIVAMNSTYFMCIFADHDVMESVILNHIELKEVVKFDTNIKSIAPDWGTIQVSNSSNFLNDRLNLFGFLFGNINYQIEHHLFPGMNHIHLPRISPIVRQTCKEFGVEYVSHASLYQSFQSFCLAIRTVSKLN